jgi:broad specificity phosphatase PhoE
MPILGLNTALRRVVSSVGRALRLHRRCREFEPLTTHHRNSKGTPQGVPFFIAQSRVSRYLICMIKHPIFLLRHGQTEWNLEGRLQGRLDSPLTQKGQAQAVLQRDILAPILETFPSIDFHASPLGRAWDTARSAAGDHSVQKNDLLMEVSAGSWEGRLRADIVAERGGSAAEEDMFDLFLSAPDGEGAEALDARCRSYLSALTGPTVIVSHGVVSAFLRGLLRGLELPDIARLSHNQGVVFALNDGAEVMLQSRADAASYLADIRA